MSILRRKGDKAKYSFLDRLCIGRECFAPGMFQHRGATMKGSRNTGTESPCCMNRAYHGCPSGLLEFDAKLAKERKEKGWRNE